MGKGGKELGKQKIVKILIFRKCKECDGKGVRPGKPTTIYYNTIDKFDPCEACKGKGKEPTDLFLEVPKEMPKLKEWWT